MGHRFEQHRAAEVPATAAEVWEAIATGPGITSWFMGRSEVDAGAVRTAFGGYAPELAISAAEGPRRFAYGSEPGDDGRFIAYEFLIEGRTGASTVVRTVTSGFLPGDDWSDEYEAMTLGTDLYFRTLVEYLSCFVGRHASPVTAFGPDDQDWARTRAGILDALGLRGPVAAGDPVHAHIDGIGRIDGTVYFANTRALGVRTGNALLRFIQGFGKGPIVAHLVFGPVEDIDAAESTWLSWVSRLGRGGGPKVVQNRAYTRDWHRTSLNLPPVSEGP